VTPFSLKFPASSLDTLIFASMFDFMAEKQYTNCPMRKYNPYRNIFYYYRGPSNKRKDEHGDKQLEDNTTKALINALENSEKGLLEHFLKQLDINPKSFHKVSYDLQIAEEKSRPDALIEVGSSKIFIESKMDCPLIKNQIVRHMKNIPNGHLICITPRKSDSVIVERLNNSRIRFIIWKDVYLCFQAYFKKAKNDKARFVINEFVNYLEAINMAPFYGWHKSHFEAFLNIEDDPKKELRLRVKENLRQYLTEIREHLKTISLFEDLQMKVGNVQVKDARHCSGVLCTPPLDRIVHTPHFNFAISADEFMVGVHIGGKKPADDFRTKVKRDAKAFFNILKHLDGFDLVIRKRIRPDNRPRSFHAVPIAQIALGTNVSEHDIEFISRKIDQYRLFEVSCLKSFKRDDATIGKASFLKTSAKFMKKLEPFYRFCKS